MKNTILVILLSLTAAISTVNAEETSAGIEDYTVFCTEQAQLAGIEDENDLKQYVKDCLESYVGPAAE